MFQTQKATFVANLKENVVEITQLLSSKTEKVAPEILLSLLQYKFIYGKKCITKFCSKGRINISFGSNKHLYSSILNIYLTKGLDKQLVEYILDKFNNTKKPSETLHLNETASCVDFKDYLDALPVKTLFKCYDQICQKIIYESQISNEELPWRV
jgi:hypothetical protein